MRHVTRPDWFGRALAVLTFLAGIWLLLVVFRLAYLWFQVPPRELFRPAEGSAPDLQGIISGVWASIRGLLLLSLMALVGGMIANRGIHLYFNTRASEHSKGVIDKKN